MAIVAAFSSSAPIAVLAKHANAVQPAYIALWKYGRSTYCGQIRYDLKLNAASARKLS